jgi:putative addiction module component (TIGR02574 family)
MVYKRICVMADTPLPSAIRNLPRRERLDLVEQIWNSIVDDQKSFELTDAQKAELDRRLAARQTSPDRGASWEEVKQRLLTD